MKFVFVLVIFTMFLRLQIVLGAEITGDISIRYRQVGGSYFIPSNSKKNTMEKEIIEVKGAFFYQNGKLLKYGEKIYIIENQMKRHIRTLKELFDYRGKEIIDVDFTVINSYPSRDFRKGDLIRGDDMRIFVILDNGAKHILNIRELQKNHFGKIIHNIPDKLLRDYIAVV